MGKDIVDKIPCCPELIKDDNCDEIYFTRTLNYPIRYNEKLTFNGQLILGFKLKRCSKGLVLGDPVYTTTLLPGEKVRLLSTDKRTKFKYDAELHSSYRNEQLSEESYFMTATQEYFSQYENTQEDTGTSSNKGHWDFKGEVEGSLSWLGLGGASASTNEKYNYDNSSTFDYLLKQSSNMKSSATQAANVTQTAHSLSIGEVNTKQSIEGSTEEQYESSSRVFENYNKAHAVNYLFYRLNKKQVIHFELVKIERIIHISTTPTMLATIAPEHITPRHYAAERKSNLSKEEKNSKVNETPELRLSFNTLRNHLDDLFRKELIEAMFIDENGKITEFIKDKVEFHYEFSLPTAGIIVKGCLDDCNTLEPERERYYKLQNDLLEKQIALLEKSQEYRCCPPSPIINDD